MKNRFGNLRPYAKHSPNIWARYSWFVVLAFGSLALAGAQQPAQSKPAQPPTAPVPASGAPSDASKAATPQTPQQKQLEDDTAKLLVLANELKTEMDKSTKDMLSLSVIKKAEAVEKLARKVRDEMKTTLQN
ncbi:MAG TPA: hypothetical protein VL967_05950 [Terracidiphilus sp.]|nr:hypothetical protein [Terracidiphilus sp.]